MERANSSFEDQWQQAFDGVEKTPPVHVWTSIDGMLANQEASKSKKRVIFFKWVAAASVLLAVVSSIALFDKTFNTDSVVAVSEKVDESTITSNEEKVLISDDRSEVENIQQSDAEQTTAIAKASGDKNRKSEETIGTLNEEKTSTPSGNSKLESTLTEREQRTPTLALVADDSEENDEESGSLDQIKNIDDFSKKPTLDVPAADFALVEAEGNEENVSVENVTQSEELDEFLVIEALAYQPRGDQDLWEPEQLYGVPILSAMKDVEKYDIRDLWAGVSFGSGSFNPGSGGGENQELAFAPSEIDQGFIANAEQIPVMNTYSSGSSFAAGLDVGSRLSKKVVLRSGLFYNHVSPGSSTNIIVTDNQTNTSYALADAQESARLNDGLQSNNLSFSQGTTNFNNTLQYISIPLKAGYIIVDRKVNLVLNSGVSTNILVGSSLNNPDGGLSNFSDEGVADTFSATYFDLLTSIELGYRLKEKYYISLEPNYRRAINNYTKSESNIEGKPTNIGVSLGVKYNF
ncbi:MAG: hypothetical protein JXQ96_12435 [Cyclobacteriaceae bacterium]